MINGNEKQLENSEAIRTGENSTLIRIWIIAGILLVLILSALDAHAEGCKEILNIDIKNDGVDCITDTVRWMVQENCEGPFSEVTCEEDQELTIITGGTETAVCTSPDAPLGSEGEHCVMVTWCGKTEGGVEDNIFN